MKASCFRSLCAAVSLAAVSPLQAQTVVHTPDEIIVSGRFTTAAAATDVAVIDRRTGQVRSLQNLAGGVVPGPVGLSGVADISEASAGTLGRSETGDALLLVSRNSHQLARISPHQPTLGLAVYESPGPSPAGAVALSFTGSTAEATGDVWVSSALTNTPGSVSTLTLTTPGVSTLTTRTSGNQPFNFREGRRTRYATTLNWLAGFMADDATTSRLRVFSSQVGGGGAIIFTAVSEFNGLPLGSQYVSGPLDGTTGMTFVFFVPGTQTLQWVRTTGIAGGSVPNSFNASAAIESLIPVNQGAAHGILAIFTGGTQAQFYQFNGAAFVAGQSFSAPAGQRWTGGAAGNGETRLFLLSGPAAGGGSTSWRRMTVQAGGTYLLDAQGSLPLLTSASPAHVFAFSAEPFADSMARLTDVRRVADWTLGTAVLPGTRIMSGQRESFGTSTAGLGSRTAFSLSPAAAVGSTWMLANQYTSDTSVFALMPGTVSPFEPEVKISPPSSHEEFPAGPVSPPLVRQFSFTGTTGAGFLYRTSPIGSFTTYNAATPPSFTVSSAPSSTTVEFYASFGTSRSRLQRATYSFGAVDPVTVPPSTDADGDGLADEWERWYGVGDPNGDADGDGINNITEQNIGSDPLFHCGEDMLPLEITMQTVGSGPGAILRVRLTRGLRAGEVLQRSTNLSSWTNVILAAGATQYDEPVGQVRAFFRLTP